MLVERQILVFMHLRQRQNITTTGTETLTGIKDIRIHIQTHIRKHTGEPDAVVQHGNYQPTPPAITAPLSPVGPSRHAMLALRVLTLNPETL